MANELLKFDPPVGSYRTCHTARRSAESCYLEIGPALVTNLPSKTAQVSRGPGFSFSRTTNHSPHLQSNSRCRVQIRHSVLPTIATNLHLNRRSEDCSSISGRRLLPVAGAGAGARQSVGEQPSNLVSSWSIISASRATPLMG